MLSKPLSRDEVERLHPARPALRQTDLQVSFQSVVIPPKPGVRVFPPPVQGTVLQRPDRAAVSDALRDAAKRFGAGLADLSEDQLKELGGEIAERLARVSRIRTHGTQGFLPDHLPFKPILPQLEEHRRTRPFIGPRVWQCFDRLKPGEFQATTIFKWGCHMNGDISVFPGCSRPSTQRRPQPSSVSVRAT
jgi:hypothetical protein